MFFSLLFSLFIVLYRSLFRFSLFSPPSLANYSYYLFNCFWISLSLVFSLLLERPYSAFASNSLLCFVLFDSHVSSLYVGLITCFRLSRLDISTYVNGIVSAIKESLSSKVLFIIEFKIQYLLKINLKKWSLFMVLLHSLENIRSWVSSSMLCYKRICISLIFFSYKERKRNSGQKKHNLRKSWQLISYMLPWFI